MKTFFYFISFIFFTLWSLSSVFAQDGMYDARFNVKASDCAAGYYSVVVEVKAMDAATVFNMSDQNYRFSFNKKAVRPFDPNEAPATQSVQIEQQILTGIAIDHEGGVSFYDPQTLTGTIDSVVSYNVVLGGGVGYRLKHDEWAQIGCLRFEILDGSICPEFKWHDSNPDNFPRTFIGEKFNNVLFEADENTYGNIENCEITPCNPINLPVELIYFEGSEDENCKINLTWSTASETDNSHFVLMRSYNGTDFREIAQILGFGDGTSTSVLTYNFVDHDPGRTNYYKLDQVDIDGIRVTSEVTSLKSTCYDGVIGISDFYPNPIRGKELATIKLISEYEMESTVLVTDVLGRIVDEFSASLIEGPNKIQYDAVKLSAGTFFMQVKGADWHSAPKKFVKVLP